MNLFFSTHGVDDFSNYNIILPIVTNIEKVGLYLNGEGRLQEMKLIQIPPQNCKEDWKLLLEIYDILYDKKINNLDNYMLLKEKINFLCNLNLNIVGYTNFYKKINKKYRMHNLAILPSILNLYDNKIITKYSRILLKFRQNIFKNNYN